MNAIEDVASQVAYFFKGKKKAKRIRQCRKCRRYSVECPYCHTNIETVSLPLEMTCVNCNKTFYIKQK